MKKYSIYIGVLLAGLTLGWLLFGTNSNESTSHTHSEKSSKTMWTCSMHPQIMQPDAGDCPICGMDLIPAEAGAEGLGKDQFKLTKNAMALANIQTAFVGNGFTKKPTLSISGKIVPNEETNVVQASYFNGRIEQLYINATGETIVKGQLLATLYAPELIKAQQELLTALSLKEQQPKLYEAVRNKLKLWKLSEKQIQHIENTNKVQEYIPIYATVSGIIIAKFVAQGDYVKQGQALYNIANLNSVWANFDIYEHQLNRFSKGQTIRLASNAYPNELFTGTVSFIDPVVNPSTRTVNMRVVVPNTSGKFKPGMFVSGSIDVSTSNKNNALSIPASAVLWTGKRSIVYVKTAPDQPVFELREVRLGNRFGDQYEVVNGLTSGEEIVTNGTFTVDASAQLAGKKSMMNHEKQLSESFTVVKAFKTQLQNSYEAYISLKDALIKSDGKTAQQAAKQLNSTLTNIDMTLLINDAAQKQWMQLSKVLVKQSQEMTTTEEVSTLRTLFKPLSNHFIEAVQSFGIMETTYKQYCPMADSDKGGYWLSKEDKVLNPYFGDMMLKCGEVQQTIKQ